MALAPENAKRTISMQENNKPHQDIKTYFNIRSAAAAANIIYGSFIFFLLFFIGWYLLYRFGSAALQWRKSNVFVAIFQLWQTFWTVTIERCNRRWNGWIKVACDQGNRWFSALPEYLNDCFCLCLDGSLFFAISMHQHRQLQQLLRVDKLSVGQHLNLKNCRDGTRAFWNVWACYLHTCGYNFCQLDFFCFFFSSMPVPNLIREKKNCEW